jgi:diguanylate cyclase (GGDEF)-like protein
MIDIDFFKRVNDTFGHEMGDWVLKMVATTITSAKRDPDVAARIGGEEFALLLPETTLEAAKSVAERIRELVRKNALAIGKEAFSLTISIGVAEATIRSSGIEAVLREADHALDEAKQSGRNQVRVAKRPVEMVSHAAAE